MRKIPVGVAEPVFFRCVSVGFFLYHVCMLHVGSLQAVVFHLHPKSSRTFVSVSVDAC